MSVCSGRGASGGANEDDVHSSLTCAEIFEKKCDKFFVFSDLSEGHRVTVFCSMGEWTSRCACGSSFANGAAVGNAPRIVLSS